MADNSGNNTNIIKVKEYKTETPLTAVKIDLYHCSRFDYQYGCQYAYLFASHITDENGEYAIMQAELDKADEGIILSKFQYWGKGAIPGENYMEPEAWINIQLKQINSYADTCAFRLITLGELAAASVLDFRVPKDSTVKFTLFGNEINKITWMVYPKLERCVYGCFNDTIASGTIIVTPQKFETLSMSLNY